MKKGYIKNLKEDIPDAEILNFENPVKLKNLEIERGFPLLLPKKVCQAINMAKVGVMLSAKEGASYASVEYLLAGIPVVSTISQGGRDVFFDKRFCRIVPSNPKAIKYAVNSMIKKNISPKYFLQSEASSC